MLQPYDTEIGKTNFMKYSSALPSSFNVVSAGGWNKVYTLSQDPKAELVSIIASGLKSTDGVISKGAVNDESIDTIVSLLESRGKGFSADLIDGEWSAVFSRSGNKSPKFQKLIGKTEKAKRAFSNFSIKDMKFQNVNYTRRGNGELKAVLKVSISSKIMDLHICQLTTT